MPRACKACGRVVAEAAYCPFCSQPTIEHIPAHSSQNDAMTIRERFERKKPSDTGGFDGSSLIASGGLILVALVSRSPAFIVLAIFAFIVIQIVAFIVIPIVREETVAKCCPRCVANLGQFNQNIRYCPFCGVDLNVEINRKSHEPTEFLKKEWKQREIKNTDIQLPSGIRKVDTDLQLPPGKRVKGTA
jgi:hypothetical protein